MRDACYCPHLSGEGIEAQRGRTGCLQSPTQREAGLRAHTPHHKRPRRAWIEEAVGLLFVTVKSNHSFLNLKTREQFDTLLLLKCECVLLLAIPSPHLPGLT